MNLSSIRDSLGSSFRLQVGGGFAGASGNVYPWSLARMSNSLPWVRQHRCCFFFMWPSPTTKLCEATSDATIQCQGCLWTVRLRKMELNYPVHLSSWAKAASGMTEFGQNIYATNEGFVSLDSKRDMKCQSFQFFDMRNCNK